MFTGDEAHLSVHFGPRGRSELPFMDKSRALLELLATIAMMLDLRIGLGLCIRQSVAVCVADRRWGERCRTVCSSLLGLLHGHDGLCKKNRLRRHLGRDCQKLAGDTVVASEVSLVTGSAEGCVVLRNRSRRVGRMKGQCSWASRDARGGGLCSKALLQGRKRQRRG